MRILLVISVIVLTLSESLSAQSDFITLDSQTYDYYLKGDYKNLKKTADTLFSQGIDYYWLRMRLGILAFNDELYFSALNHLTKSLEFNSSDTVSREYIYYSYLFSGRKADANLYLESIPPDKKNNALKLLRNAGSPEFNIGSSAYGSDVTLYGTNNLYYEAVKNSISFNPGFDYSFSSRFKGTFAYTNYRKTGTRYSAYNPSGTEFNFNQNQFYGKLTGYYFPGWEFSGFGHIVSYKDIITTYQTNTEFLGGFGISKTGWKIRTEANLSFSNFSKSNQIRGEAYLTYLPFSNLNLYFTSGGMYQNDKIWGATYQINQEIGLKVFKFLWLESGIVKGNSFLYSRNQGYLINNSFQIPVKTLYSNIIILPGKHFSLTISPFFTENHIYSWDFNAYSRTDKLNQNSFGGVIRLTYKNI